MRILITGATGLIGTALANSLRRAEHDVLTLSRNKGGNDCCDHSWDPYNDELDSQAFEGVDAVVHLAGENIAGRWTDSKKKRIRESRIKPTSLLCKTISNLPEPPKTLLCASAIGYYGNRGDESLDEASKFGSGFLADVTREWEAATTTASVKGIRVVNMRIGVVLSDKGGALEKMLPPFKLGVGGNMGNGSQFWSWVTIDDIIGAVTFLLAQNEIEGPVNLVSPNPVTNAEFTSILGKVISRPTIFPMPAFAAKIALGEMADALLLSSSKVKPQRLLDAGYEFKHSELEPALRSILSQ